MQDVLPTKIGPPPTTTLYTTITSSIVSTQTNENGLPINTWTNGVSTMTLIVSEAPPLVFATPLNNTIASSTSTSSPPLQTSAPAQKSSTSSNGTPLSTLIPAIVVPIVVVALVAPVALYFCLTRHDRQRSKSRATSRISSRVYPEARTEFKRPNFRHSSSETGASKASEIMNFDLGSAVEKPLPVVKVTPASYNTYERPDTLPVHRGLDSSIGQAVSRYSGGHDSYSNIVNASQNRTSIQELSEENMRIARLVNDSRVSFGERELDQVSDISAPEERISRHVGRRGIDELSDVSSIYEDETAASSDRGGGILGNLGARRSGHLR